MKQKETYDRNSMSVETLLAITRLYGFTMDGLIYGTEDTAPEAGRG